MMVENNACLKEMFCVSVCCLFERLAVFLFFFQHVKDGSRDWERGYIVL